MPISRFRIQNILKTCQKNFRWYHKKTGSTVERTQERDWVKISTEARRTQICQKAANEVIERLTKARHGRASNSKESQ